MVTKYLQGRDSTQPQHLHIRVAQQTITSESNTSQEKTQVQHSSPPPHPGKQKWPQLLLVTACGTASMRQIKKRPIIRTPNRYTSSSQVPKGRLPGAAAMHGCFCSLPSPSQQLHSTWRKSAPLVSSTPAPYLHAGPLDIQRTGTAGRIPLAHAPSVVATAHAASHPLSDSCADHPHFIQL